MKKLSEKSGTIEIVQKIVGLGESSIQKSYYPKLQEKIHELEMEKEKYQSIFDNAINGIFRMSIDGIIYESNPAFVNILGYDSPEEVRLNVNFRNFFAEDFIWDKMINELVIKGRISNYQFEFRKKDLKSGWLSVNLSVSAERKDIIEGFAEDISDKKGMEQRLLHSQKMDAIGQLAGGVAHDFNNMLGGILGAADMLEKNVTKEGKQYLDVIVQASERAADLVAKLLAFGRKSKTVFKPLSINSVIDNAVAILERSINKKVVIYRKYNAQDFYVKGDESQLQNVFINMGINAGHAMPDGGELVFETLNVTADSGYCQINCPDILPGEYIQIMVKDTGFGIPEENIDKIFEPFFTTKELGKGTGLGLSAVYGTVKEHNGSVSVKSSVGKGTLFNIYIPVSENTVENRVGTDSEILKGGIALIADDEEINRLIISAILSDLNFTVIAASNGKEALDLFKKNIKEIDVILLDMYMPEMDGKEAFRQIKEIDPAAKIIIASGLSKEEFDPDLLNEGVSCFLSKPFRKNEIAKAISNLY